MNDTPCPFHWCINYVRDMRKWNCKKGKVQAVNGRACLVTERLIKQERYYKQLEDGGAC